MLVFFNQLWFILVLRLNHALFLIVKLLTLFLQTSFCNLLLSNDCFDNLFFVDFPQVWNLTLALCLRLKYFDF